MIALVHGPDAAIARAEVERLLRQRDPDRASTTHLDGRTVATSQIAASIGTVGLFGESRVVVVHDLLSRGGRSGQLGPEDEGRQEPRGAVADLTSLFAAVPAGNTLILADPELPAVPVAVKKLLPADAVVIAGEPPRGTALINWVVKRAREEGAEVDAATARHLVSTLFPQTWSAKPANPRFDRPPDLSALANEVAKLALAAHPGPIQRQHVDALVAAGDDDRVFKFIEAAAIGRLSVGLPELRRLLDAGEEPAKLAAQLLQHCELAGVLDAAGPRVDPVAVGRALGLPNPNRMSGVAGSVRGSGSNSGITGVHAGVATDRKQKRGELRTPEDVLYDLVIELAVPRGATRAATRRSGGT